jgi:hypothetical protein
MVLILLVAAVLAWAAPVAAQDTPIPNTAQHVICDSGCGSPPASADRSTFTGGVTNVSLIGAAFNDALAALASGTYAAPRMTAYRALHVNLRDASGNTLGDGAAAPLWVTGTNFQLTPNGDVPFITEIMGATDSTLVGNSGSSLNVICTAGCAAGTPGQTTMANSSPVVIASNQSAVAVSGPVTDTQLRATPVPVSGTVTVTDGAGALNVIVDSGTVTANAGTNLNTSLLALEAGGNLASIKTDVDKIPSQGQALAAASMPVVLPAAQITTLTPPAAITGFNLEATQLLIKAKTDNLDAALSTLATQTTLASTLAMLTTLNAKILQAQQLMAASLSVTVASDQPPILTQLSPRPSLPLPPCNPVRRVNCQAKGF